jgi:hypothetical protein
VGDKETVSASLVFKLSQDRQDVAVKVMPLPSEDSIKDVRIACMLNNLTDTPVFVKTFGWLKCSEIPSLWLKGLNIKKDAPRSFACSKMFLFQVMAFSSHAWSDTKIQLDVEEYRVMLFMLLHGLWVAKEKHQFRHHDIHEGQILFQTCKPDTVVTLAVGENRYTLKCERFIPKLIDFGFATLEDVLSEEESSGEGMFERFEGEEDVHDDCVIYSTRLKSAWEGLTLYETSGIPLCRISSCLILFLNLLEKPPPLRSNRVTFAMYALL